MIREIDWNNLTASIPLIDDNNNIRLSITQKNKGLFFEPGLNISTKIDEKNIVFFIKLLKLIDERNLNSNNYWKDVVFVYLSIFKFPYNIHIDKYNVTLEKGKHTLLDALILLYDKVTPLSGHDCATANGSEVDIATIATHNRLIDMSEFWTNAEKTKISQESKEVTLYKSEIRDGKIVKVPYKYTISAVLYEVDYFKVLNLRETRIQAISFPLLLRVICPSTAKHHYLMVPDNKEIRENPLNGIAWTCQLPKRLLEEDMIDRVRLYRHGDIFNVSVKGISPQELKDIFESNERIPLTAEQYIKLLEDHA